MKPVTWKNLSASARTAALQRPAQGTQPRTAAAVRDIIAEVRRDGDAALRRLTAKFDGAALKLLQVPASEIAPARRALSPQDRWALKTAFRNIRAFHQAQRSPGVRV